MPRVDHRVSRRPYWAHSDPNTPSVHTEPPCPGRCNDRWRTAEAGRDPADPNPFVPIDGDPVWCTASRNKLYYALANLPYLAALLAVEAEHGTSPEAERVSGSTSRPLHERDAVTLLIDAIWSGLVEREDQVRRERHLSPRVSAGVRRGVQLQAAALFLPRHVDWFLQQRPNDDRLDPDTGEHLHSSARAFADQIAALERRALHATRSDERKPELRPDVPCPDCDLKALEYEISVSTQLATGDTRCRSCSQRFSPARMEQWLAILAYHGRHSPATVRAWYGIGEPDRAESSAA